MSRLIFLGPPGAGKGTQAVSLSKICQVPHISTGDILRSAVAHKTELGKKAEFYMNAGELVPDDLVLDLIRERLSQTDASGGWVLDGFPRNVPQAVFLDDLLEAIQQPCDFVVNLDVPDEVIIARLLKRGRQDDTEDVIRNRLQVYREQTAPLIDFYRSRQQLVSIDGNQPMEVVTEELKKIISS
ncbi:MAG: adenylate kinase [Leptolyngbyaceae cyanobacterium SM1_1_3]|nr:adenylate kinase [Leptolyngbyaceae cyanobacterium SM1_1_3]NJM85795.1 adenylate kinase [Leptolyngbyaceae cyanobacterium RM2_2_21]NJN03181.1 adenylate kinase [Leptolyngbyaceae cyanobacterium RM1_1_2]NJO08898.1 adenylate kinase [Leptolyngbyaceae cyanobacterium SL_1_1]